MVKELFANYTIVDYVHNQRQCLRVTPAARLMCNLSETEKKINVTKKKGKMKRGRNIESSSIKIKPTTSSTTGTFIPLSKDAKPLVPGKVPKPRGLKAI